MGDVLRCVAVDSTGTCTETAWMPPPYALPPMSAQQAAICLGFLIPLWLIGAWVKSTPRVVESDD